MPSDSANPETAPLPSLSELGRDLLQVTSLRRVLTIGLPFAIMGSYAVFAILNWWPLAVISVMALCFMTYGSSSHDLVHQTLGLSRGWSQFWLSLIELLSLRSGTAYRLSHLHHHQHLLHVDDVEDAAVHFSLIQTLLSGPLLQIRLWCWAWSAHPRQRPQLFLEAIGIATLLTIATLTARWTLAPLIYAALVIAGSWIFPLITVYIPHIADGQTPLTQTRLFRGWWARLLALDHLYHLEHHLYPAVPHHHWRQLAVRLDPHFRKLGVHPYGSKAASTIDTFEQQ